MTGVSRFLIRADGCGVGTKNGLKSNAFQPEIRSWMFFGEAAKVFAADSPPARRSPGGLRAATSVFGINGKFPIGKVV